MPLTITLNLKKYSTRTALFTTEEKGAYISLMVAYWTDCQGIQDKNVMSIMGVSNSKIKIRLKTLFRVDKDGVWHHKGMEIKKEKIKDDIPYKTIIDEYHSILKDLPKVYKLTEARKTRIRILWKDESHGLPGVDKWQNFYHHVSQSDFLMGRVKSTTHTKSFLATFEWLINPNNFVRIAEDKYENRKQVR